MIVDDEAIARQRLCRLLAEDPEVEITAECADGREALQVLSETETDVVFLDVEMPELDGFGVVRALPAERLPVVVFVTAYDHYAIQAFEAHALDYLLKPFRRERLLHALERARQQAALRDPTTFRKRFSSMDNRLIVRDGRNLMFLDLAEVDWIEGAGNYACVHCGSSTYIVRETLTHLESRLKGTALVRIHRSSIVNSLRVRSIRPWINGDHHVMLKDGTRLTLSRRYGDRLQQLIKEDGK